MTEVSDREGTCDRRPSCRPQSLAQSLLVALVLSILGAAAYFGYSVYRDRQTNFATSAAGRLVGMLQKQVREKPNDVILRVRLGEALGGMGKYADATEQLNAALKIDPKHIGAHLDLGLVALAAENPNAAESYFKKVLDLTEGAQYAALDQSRELALYNLGLLAMDKKDYGEAAGFFKAALVIRKDSSDTYYQLAKALQGMDEIDGAIQQLEIGSSSTRASPRRTTSWASSTRRRRTTSTRPTSSCVPRSLRPTAIRRERPLRHSDRPQSGSSRPGPSSPAGTSKRR